MFSRFIFALLLAYSSVGQSAEISPHKVLESAGSQLFSRIAESQQEIKKSPQLMNRIVEEELMPSIDHRYAAYRILGKHLRKITKAQRAEFVKSMRGYLASTYTTALRQYKNQKVVFEKPKPVKGKRIVAIKMQLIEMNKPAIQIVFKMRMNKKTRVKC